MRRIVKIVTLLTLAVMLAAPLYVNAADKVKSEVIMKTGNKVHLFHSGTADVKKEVCVGDTLTVYRMTGKSHQQQKEVGQVKVLGYSGEHYFEAEVVKGEIKPGDIAQKGTASCLVQPVMK